MGYKIGVKRDRDNALVRKMYYDDQGLQLKPEGDDDHPLLPNGEKAGVITWYLDTLKGRNQKKIGDEMVDMNTKKGTAKMKTGTAAESRIIGSVVFVEGLEWANGTAVETINQRAFADLEQWQINQLGEWIDELNQDSDDDQEASKKEF